MNRCWPVFRLAKKEVREAAVQFVRAADGSGDLAAVKAELERGIQPEWALPLDSLPDYLHGQRAEVAYVVDNLGIPEASALYKLLSGSGYLVTVRCFYNRRGDTATFKEQIGISTLAELAARIAAQYRSVPDLRIHALQKKRLTFEEAVEEVLRRIRWAETEFLADAESLVIVSDHGYDVLKDSQGYYFAHGVASGARAFSRIAILISAGKI